MPTIQDVARASGVAKSTVSEVLNNGRRPVHPQTRERVLAAVRDLGYQPSAIARGLTKRRMNTLGVVFPHWEGTLYGNAYLLALLDGILTLSTRRRQSVMLLTFTDWDEAATRSEITDGRCDGALLLIPPPNCAVTDTLRRRGLPFVVVHGKDPSGEIACLDIDNVQAAADAARYLLQLGHRRLAFVRHDWDRRAFFYQERRRGLAEAVAAVDGASWVELTPEEVLAQPGATRSTGLLCCYDGIALTLLDAFAAQGVRVPDEVSVIGFDDIPAAVAGRPPLTTVRQPVAQITERAVQRLLALIDAATTPLSTELLPTELIVRSSTAPR